MLNRLNEEIKTAMKAKAQVRLSVLRMMKSKIMLVDTKGDITEDEVVKILKKYAKGVKETITISEEHGKTEAANEAKAELEIVQEFLPAELTEEQVKEEVQKIVAGLEEADQSNFGKVMKECMVKLQGADGVLVKKAVQDIINKQS
jgi:uncharacterized protein